MNHGSSGSFAKKTGLTVSKALFGFLQFKTAEGLSPTTLVSYEQILKVWVTRFGDRPVDGITPDDLRNHLAWLRTEYKPPALLRERPPPLAQKPAECLHRAFGFFRVGEQGIRIRESDESGAGSEI